MPAPEGKDGRQSLGKWGEDLAVERLISENYTILERNWRCRYGEIDIIATDAYGTLCFVEVRTSRGGRFGGAAASITARKRKHMSAAAALFLAERRIDAPARFDVIALQREGGGWRTEHFVDAFPMEPL